MELQKGSGSEKIIIEFSFGVNLSFAQWKDTCLLFNAVMWQQRQKNVLYCMVKSVSCHCLLLKITLTISSFVKSLSCIMFFLNVNVWYNVVLCAGQLCRWTCPSLALSWPSSSSPSSSSHFSAWLQSVSNQKKHLQVHTVLLHCLLEAHTHTQRQMSVFLKLPTVCLLSFSERHLWSKEVTTI